MSEPNRGEQVRSEVRRAYQRLARQMAGIDASLCWQPVLDTLFGVLLIELMVVVGVPTAQTEEESMVTELLTVEELAQRLRVPRSWVYGKTRLNEIPHLRVGRHIRFAWDELEDWMRANAASAHQQPEARDVSV